MQPAGAGAEGDGEVVEEDVGEDAQSTPAGSSAGKRQPWAAAAAYKVVNEDQNPNTIPAPTSTMAKARVIRWPSVSFAWFAMPVILLPSLSRCRDFPPVRESGNAGPFP